MFNELSTLGDTLDKRYAANERQRLADLQAGQARSDTANQRRILTEAPPVNWGMPEGYRFGTQNAQAPAPQQVGIRPPSAGTSGPQVITPTPGAWRGRDSTGRNAAAPAPAEQERTHLWHAEGSDPTLNTPYGESVGKAFALPFQLIGKAAKAITSAPGSGGPLDPQRGAQPQNAKLDALREQEVNRNVQAARANRKGAAPAAPGYANEPAMRATATGDIGAATGAIDREIAALQADYSRVTDPRDKAALGEELQRLQAQRTKYAGSTYTPGNQQQAAPSQAPQQAGAPAQPQAPAATYSGMGPGGNPQMLQEQVQMAQFRYNQLAQMLPHAPPEQQMKIHAELGSLQAGVRAQQAYMLASQADTNPQALGQLVSLAGAQAARTQDGMYVFVGPDGKAASQPMTGGQMGAYVYRAMDANARTAQAKLQEQIALERAKGAIKTEGEMAVEGVKGNNAMQLARLQGINAQSKALADAQAKGAHVTTSPSGDAFVTTPDGKLYRVAVDGNVTAVNLQPGANPGMTADFMAQ